MGLTHLNVRVTRRPNIFVGEEIEVRPGIVKKDAEGTVTCSPIYSQIVSLFAEQNELR